MELSIHKSFISELELPEPLKDLDRLSMNFYWSWHPDGAGLFRDLAPYVWGECEQHPRKLMAEAGELRFWQKAADPEYLTKLRRFTEEFDRYMAAPMRSMFPNGPSPEHPAAYFCAEYGVHNSLPNYSGGLGILAGDHLKSASDMNAPLVAIGLLYRYGYFRQDISHEGLQEEHYSDIFDLDLAITPVVNEFGERVTVTIHIRGREVHAQAWLAQIGRIPLYLLDTNVETNAEVDRLITGHLYGGDSETRIVQEKVLGIGGVRLLRKLGIDPSVYHLNEGHSAFLTLELATEEMKRDPNAAFEQIRQVVREKCVFTTHTPVAAGNDVFDPKILGECFSKEYLQALKLGEDSFYALGRVDPDDRLEYFGMTPFALRMCRSANGVSKKHGEVSRELWKDMFADLPEAPISHITNGVHPPTWIAPVFQRLFAEQIGGNWKELINNREIWQNAVAALSDKQIWETHLLLKNTLIAFIRERTQRKETGLADTINERAETRGLFSSSVLTIGFARRVAQYKRWDLILHDLDRLLNIVDEPERPVQFVFAGKAHPQDRTAKGILKQLMNINHDSDWQKRAVFIEDYDQEVARYMVQGVDVWMNVPRRPFEASGTSGMKAAMNGVLNLSILDGWWIEGYNGLTGFAIGDQQAFENDADIDAEEAGQLYRMLEDVLVPMYYERDQNGIPATWVDRMRASIAELTPMFSSDRMVTDYFRKIYGGAIGSAYDQS